MATGGAPPATSSIPKLLGKGIEWTFLSLLFGLLQLWLDVGARLGTPELSLFSVIKDGAILFFVTGVVMGIAIDFHMDQKKSSNTNFIKRLMFLAIPFMVMILAFIAYGMTRKEIPPAQVDFFILINASLSVLSIAYSIGTKAYLYKE
ncbi:hypothetical protein [Variovorax sp. 770b2]|uniref:hypothetical protein n=1 Tax=Variovorax sp. 770b2 TaxID=1566271 RepID=UPI0011608F0A|nr:hypothetical protein [Variovorax sp. 770b2]